MINDDDANPLVMRYRGCVEGLPTPGLDNGK